MREEYLVKAVNLFAYKSDDVMDVVKVEATDEPQDAATVAEAANEFSEFILSSPSYAVSLEAVTQAYNALYITELSFATFKRLAAKHLTEVYSPEVNGALVWVNQVAGENLLTCKDFRDLLDEAWKMLNESIEASKEVATDNCCSVA